MRWIIDLVLLLIIILCAWRGFRNGLIAGILALCAVLFSVYAADILADTYSGEFTKMLEPFVTGVVDTASSSAEEYFEKKGKEPGVYDMTYKTLEGVGFMKTAAENVSREIAEEATETGPALRRAIVDKLCSVAAYVLTYIIMFVLLIIIFGVIGNLFNLAFKLPGLELVNGVLGTLLGLAKGLVYVFAIAWALRFTGMLLPEDKVNTTILLKWLMESCPLVSFLGL